MRVARACCVEQFVEEGNNLERLQDLDGTSKMKQVPYQREMVYVLRKETNSLAQLMKPHDFGSRQHMLDYLNSAHNYSLVGRWDKEEYGDVELADDEGQHSAGSGDEGDAEAASGIGQGAAADRQNDDDEDTADGLRPRSKRRRR